MVERHLSVISRQKNVVKYGITIEFAPGSSDGCVIRIKEVADIVATPPIIFQRRFTPTKRRYRGSRTGHPSKASSRSSAKDDTHMEEVSLPTFQSLSTRRPL